VEKRGNERDVLVFGAAGRSLALPLDRVTEVIRMVALTSLPDAPPSVAGAINVRGRVVVVLDPRPRGDRAGAPARPDDFIVLVETARRCMGLIAEEIEGVRRSADELPGCDGRSGEHGSELVPAVVRLDDRLVPLVDIERLDDGAAVVLPEVHAAP
jgi:purine-binding chemotaxis protein CheW